MRIKDLPDNERPREKLIRYGVDSLSNIELLAIIIGSGTKENSAMDVAYNLIGKKGLSYLPHMPYEEYMNVKGINKIKAITLTAIFELYNRINKLDVDDSIVITSSRMIYEMYKDQLKNEKQEVLGIIILDKNKHIIHEKIIYKGTKNYVKTSIVDVLKPLVLKDGKYFYMFHNHPDGDLIPSDSDITFTKSLINEARKYDFFLLDHIIIGENGYFSFASGDSINP